MNSIEARTELQAEMLANRLRKRFRHLHKWARRLNIGAFRLYDRDIPEIPLVLDMYGDAVSGALYKRPYEKDDEEEARWLAAMGDAAALGLGLERENVIIKQREKQRGLSQYEKITAQSLTRIITEGELRFKVNLSDYLDTGLFLDARAMRRMAAADSNGKRVLNLFCYTGSFSVHSAKSGAASTDSVDLSNTYLAWARENFTLNGFEIGVRDWGVGNRESETKILKLEDYFERHNTLQSYGSHRLIRSDVAAFLRQAKAARLRWDSIILDPPAFSNSTMAPDFDLNRDHAGLLANCLALLSPGGKLWFRASSRSFKTGVAELEAALKRDFPSISVVDISDRVVDEDFIGKKGPKSFVLGSRE